MEKPAWSASIMQSGEKRKRSETDWLSVKASLVKSQLLTAHNRLNEPGSQQYSLQPSRVEQSEGSGQEIWMLSSRSLEVRQQQLDPVCVLANVWPMSDLIFVIYTLSILL